MLCFMISEVPASVNSGKISRVSTMLALHEASSDAYLLDSYFLTKYKQFTQIEQTQQLLFIG